MELYTGKIVYSKAGRDRGKFFIVIDRLDNEYVSICDGNKRRLDKPKRKKIKHLNITDAEAESIIEKINSSKKITNSDIRKSLHEFIENQETEKQ